MKFIECFSVLQKYEELVNTAAYIHMCIFFFISILISSSLEFVDCAFFHCFLYKCKLQDHMLFVFYLIAEENVQSQFLSAASKSVFMCMCAGVCGGQKRELRDLHEWELQVGSHLIWVLGAKSSPLEERALSDPPSHLSGPS